MTTQDQLLQELNELREEVTRLKAIEAEYQTLAQKTNRKDATGSPLFSLTGKFTDQHLRTLLETVPIPMFISRLSDGQITCVNHYIGEIVGLSAQEVLGRSTVDFYANPADRKFVLEAIQRDGHLYNHELRLKRPDGSEFWGVVSLQTLEFEGEPSLFAGLYDITHRKQTEQSLRWSETQFKAVLNAMPDLIFSVKRDGTVVDLRGGQDATLYKTEHEIIGKKIPEILPPNLAEQRLYYLEQAFKTGELQYFEFDIETNKGIRHEEGRFIVSSEDEAVHIIRDVTHRKRAEMELARRANALEAVARVSTAISSILELDKLMQRVTDLTKEQFKLYHVHIYLLDDTGSVLNLAAGTGDVGRKMVAQGWSIPVDETKSLVAQVARDRTGVIENNVRQVPHWLPNELLPDTQAELGVPIIVAGQLLGVLDVQSEQVDNFTDEDVAIQITLATQIGVALQNAKTFARQQETGLLLQERVKELDCLNDIGREIVDSPPIPDFLEWVCGRIPPAMQYPDLCTVAIEYEGQLYGNPAALEMPAKIVNGLRVTGEVVGRIHIAYAEKRAFLDEESAMLGGIASRVGGYIENQRLFEQTLDALAQVEQSQYFLRSLLDNIPNPIFYKDIKGAYLGFNRAFLEYLGKTEEELIGKTVYDLNTDKELADRYHEADMAVLHNPGVQIYEASVEHADGTLRDVIFNKAAFTNPDGSLGGLVGAMVDITERKRIEEALRENEARLSEATSIAQLGYWELDFQTQMFTFTDQLYALLRTTAAQEGGYQMPAMQYAQKFVHPDDAHLVSAEIEKAIETTDPNYSTQLEHRIIRADGSEGFILVRFRVIKDAQGRTIKSVGANQDITDRIQAEAERERLLDEVQAAYRQYVRREWEQYLADKHHGAWQVEYQQPDLAQTQLPPTQPLEMPIYLRGESIGTLRLQDVASDRTWTEDEKSLVETVTEQLALTIENLRLFDNTQQRAMREQLTRQIADKMHTSPDVETIIEIGLSELAKALGVSRTYVKLAPDVHRNEP